MPGQMIRGYRVVDKLGEGGMGTVYVAEHELLGKKVAIKVLLAEHSRNPELVQRFFNEARAATRINHPGIVEIFDFGHAQDGSAYIVMECLRGESLGKRLEREHTIAPKAAVRLMKQIANALGHAHRAGIVHRDLKPDNIFIVPDSDMPSGERTKILDFGIAKLADDPTSGVKTRAGVVIGTPTYMAPEQFRGSSTVDSHADIYALGVVLYEMLTGRPPFVADGFGSLMEMHLFHAPAPPRSLVPAIPAALEQVVLRALAKRPEDRQQSVNELASDLNAAVGNSADPTADPVVRAEPAAATIIAQAVTPVPVLVTPVPMPVTPLPAQPRAASQTTLGGAVGAVSVPQQLVRRGQWVAAGVWVIAATAIGVVLVMRAQAPTATSPTASSPPAASAPIPSAPAPAPTAPTAPVLTARPVPAPPAPVQPPQGAPAAAVPTDAGPADTGPASEKSAAGPAEATASRGGPPASAAGAPAAPSPGAPAERLRPRPRGTTPATAGSAACDRRIDTDCDGIPDVR